MGRTGSRLEERHAVEAWVWAEAGARLERYRHAPGPTAAIPKHSHDEYQVGLSFETAGEYEYRGRRYPIPLGALRLIQPGEVHASRDFGGAAGAVTDLLYVPAAVLRDVAEAGGRPGSDPVFPVPVVEDRELALALGVLCRALRDPAGSWLAQDSLFRDALGRVLRRHGEGRRLPPAAGREPRAVGVVKAYLEARPGENVSLATLAGLVDLHPDALVRAFGREVGLPPHRYQVQLRVARAKALLAGGAPPGAVAWETGFADQSHLGRHFKRMVGVSPGRYGAGGRRGSRERGVEVGAGAGGERDGLGREGERWGRA